MNIVRYKPKQSNLLNWDLNNFMSDLFPKDLWNTAYPSVDVKENEKEYILVNIQHDSLCAKGKILVNDWNKIEKIKNAKGQGFHGAKLMGLTFNIEKDSNNIEFVYKNLIWVLD